MLGYAPPQELCFLLGPEAGVHPLPWGHQEAQPRPARPAARSAIARRSAPPRAFPAGLSPRRCLLPRVRAHHSAGCASCRGRSTCGAQSSRRQPRPQANRRRDSPL